MSIFFRDLAGKLLLRYRYLNHQAAGGSTTLQNTFHSIVSPSPIGQGTLTGGSILRNVLSSPWSLTSVRTTIRNNWPRPKEKKRLQMNFWNRMKTPGGRAVLMRRYLKGRHILSH